MTKSKPTQPILAIAPMMKYSHNHARQLWHYLCPQASLYTEMYPALAIINKIQKFHHPKQANVCIQLAGDDPNHLTKASAIAKDLNYSKININCGCPSSRATAGSFGACLMKQPDLVANCVSRIKEQTNLPVSVKCRIAVDDLDPQTCLFEFVDKINQAGVSEVIIHVRKAWLKGLNPKQNRDRPPLEPHWANLIKQEFPNLIVITNGGINSTATASERIIGVDGVMLGRAIVKEPLLLSQFAQTWFGEKPVSLINILEKYLNYCAKELIAGEHPRRLLMPLAGLVHGQVNAKKFRQTLMQSSITGDLNKVYSAWT